MNKNIDAVLKVAKSQLGYVEGRGNYSKYGAWYGIPGYSHAAWCAMYVSYCFSQAGFPLPAIQHSKGFAYCPFGVSYFRKKGQLFKYPEVGDIVFFDWQRDGTSDHVGLVLKVYGNGKIKTIEGNTSPSNNSNGGMVMTRNRSVSFCQGFARPFSKADSNTYPGYLLMVKKPLMKGVTVLKLQNKLIEEGYVLDNDGVFGFETRQAVVNFQIDNSLDIDGVVGPATWEALANE